MDCAEIKGYHDLMPAGGKPGTIPTDLEQATGLERLEILGKMQGIDVFDMKPLDASRKGREHGIALYDERTCLTSGFPGRNSRRPHHSQVIR